MSFDGKLLLFQAPSAFEVNRSKKQLTISTANVDAHSLNIFTRGFYTEIVKHQFKEILLYHLQINGLCMSLKTQLLSKYMSKFIPGNV